MIAELRTKSQLTIPKDVVKQLNLVEGDKLEVYAKDGVIYMVPVEVYPKKYVEELHSELSKIRDSVGRGKKPIFDNIDELLKKLND